MSKENSEWNETEFEVINLGDERLNGVPSAEWRRHSFFGADAILPKGHVASAIGFTHAVRRLMDLLSWRAALAVVALVACYLPARLKATRKSPHRLRSPGIENQRAHASAHALRLSQRRDPRVRVSCLV